MTIGKPALVVGRIYTDVIFTGLRAVPTLGREEYADSVTVPPGGGLYITAAVLAGVDLFLPNSDEARTLVGQYELIPDTLRPLSDRVPNLVIKRGAKGCLGISNGVAWSVAARRGEVVDSAGDSFNAGFLHARLGGHDFPTCPTQGVAAVSLCVGMAGG